MNHQIIGQLRLFFGLQNASCCLVVVAFSLFLLVAHTCIIIIIIYCKCRGVIFFILCFFGTFSLVRITFIFWFWHFSRYSKYSSEYDEGKKKIFFWTGTRCAQTDMNVDRKKLPGWTLLSHSDVLQEIWKTFSAVVHSKIVFFFSFFSYARAGSCQIILISFFLDKTLLCLMINCTCVPYRKVSWLNINTGFSSVLLFGSCISILSNGTNGRKRMRHSNSIESKVFYFGFFF